MFALPGKHILLSKDLVWTRSSQILSALFPTPASTGLFNSPIRTLGVPQCSDWHCHGEEDAFLPLMLQELIRGTQMLCHVSSHLNWGFWALAMHKCSKFTAFPSLLLFRPKAKAAAETTWVKLAQLNSVKLLEEMQCCFLCYWSHGTWLSNYCLGAGGWPVGGAQSQNPHL